MTRIRRLDPDDEDEMYEQKDVRGVIQLFRSMFGVEGAREHLAHYGIRDEEGPVTHGGTGTGAR